MRNATLALLFIVQVVILQVGCSSGSGSSVAGVAPNEAITDQSTFELLINGTYIDNIDVADTIWVCSMAAATRGVGFVFLDDGGSEGIGLIYSRSGENFANFWSVPDSGNIRMRYPEQGTIASIALPEFSGTGVFTSSELVLFGMSNGPTTCIKEFITNPVRI